MFVWVEEHPYLSGTLAVVIIVVFLLLRNRNSSGGSVTVSDTGGSVSDAQIAAGTAVQQSAIMANAQVAGYQAQANIYSVLAAADVEKARIQGNVDLNYILASADVTNHYTDAALTLGLAQTGAAVQIAALQPRETTIVYGQQQANQTGTATQTQQQQTVQQATQQIAVGNTAGYDPSLDYSNYQGWLPPPGTGGRPTYAQLQASGEIQVCNQNTVAAQAACSQQNTAVMNRYGL